MLARIKELIRSSQRMQVTIIAPPSIDRTKPQVWAFTLASPTGETLVGTAFAPAEIVAEEAWTAFLKRYPDYRTTPVCVVAYLDESELTHLFGKQTIH